MAEEIEEEINNEELLSRKDKRIKSLSDKYELSEKEKGDLAKAKDEADAKVLAAQKDADFYKGFNTVASKYQGASEYQDKIREKVMAGYDVEDATVSVLNKEGKFVAPKAERESAAGGSANTSQTVSDKTPQEMSQDERRAALLDMEAKGEFRL